MGERFPVITVESHWVLEPEEMGSKRKFWYSPPGEPQQRWLFKYPQSGTGQHWAEKIAAEIAGSIGIPRAGVELAVFNGDRGSATKSFAHDGFELIHGNQILAAFLHDYDPQTRFRQSDHTVHNVLRAIDRVFDEDAAKRRAKELMAEYVVLDALIGNTDRHHENWGVLLRRKQDNWVGALAPSFDHASSMGRELRDESRERRLVEKQIGAYIERGRGAIYWSADESRGPSPIELVRRSADDYPEIFLPALGKLHRVNEASIDDMLHRIPSGWMSRWAMDFAKAMILYNIAQLREVLR